MDGGGKMRRDDWEVGSTAQAQAMKGTCQSGEKNASLGCLKNEVPWSTHSEVSSQWLGWINIEYPLDDVDFDQGFN